MRLLLVFALAASGCSHPLLLKKYAATSPARQVISGRTLHLAAFEDRREADWDDQKSKALPEPKDFAVKPLSAEQLEAWEQERDALETSVPEMRWTKVGHKRNGFGMPIKDVRALNSPAEWLTEAARLELKAQGAALVERPDADLVVEAVLRYAFLDLYLATWVHLVLDVTTTLRGQPPKTVRIHASEGMTAWTGGDTESFEIFTATEQRLSRYLVDHVANQLANAGEAAPPPPPP